MEQPKPILPLVQIVAERLLREVPQLPQLAPAQQGLVRRHKRCRAALCIHAREHRMQHCQQQPQHGGVLRGHFARKVHIFLRMEQCIRQGDFFHGVIPHPHPDPRFLQQVKFRCLHPLPPSDTSGRSRGRSAAPVRQGVPFDVRPAAGSVPRAAAGRAAMP